MKSLRGGCEQAAVEAVVTETRILLDQIHIYWNVLSDPYVSLYTVSHCFNNDRVAFAGHLWFLFMVYPLFYMNPHINDRYWPIWLIDNQYQRWQTWSGRLCLTQQYISLHLVWKGAYLTRLDSVLFLKLWFTVKLFMSVEKCLSSNNIIFILLLLLVVTNNEQS